VPALRQPTPRTAPDQRGKEEHPIGLERPADDPREYLALRHSLRQSQRCAFELVARQQALERTLRDEYERSLSWRITRPLRRAAAAARSLTARRAR
jgi:hypothetical protein